MLQSKFFAGDQKLEACAVSNAAHIVPGAKGEHVGKIQAALVIIDGAVITAGEIQQEFYGPTTARAVLGYKQKRGIINRTYQTQPDNIVGIMTIKSLDDELKAMEREVVPRPASDNCYHLKVGPAQPPMDPVAFENGARFPRTNL
jgi:hypothetical protein